MYTYTYKGKKGKTSSLDESKGRIVVRIRKKAISIDPKAPAGKKAQLLQLKKAVRSVKAKRLDLYEVQDYYHDAQVYVLWPINKTVDRDTTREMLKPEKKLCFAGRVMVEKKARLPIVYTENLFVQFKKNIGQPTIKKILAAEHLKIKSRIEFSPNAWFVAAPDNTGQEIFKIAQRLLSKKEVQDCHPELVHKKAKKNIHPLQWHLKPAMIEGREVNAHANVEKAHQLSKGKNVVVAIIDDGVQVKHPEFNIKGKVVHAADFSYAKVKKSANPVFHDDEHGQCCAGVAVAAGKKITGVAPLAKLMPIRNAAGLGTKNEADAIYWAVKKGADVISCSWGSEDGEWFTPNDPRHKAVFEIPPMTKAAIDHAVTKGRNGKGCIVLFAAGNGNEPVENDGYPSYKNVISVAACNDRNKKSVYSDYGPAIWCCFPSNDYANDEKPKSPVPLTKGIYTTDRTDKRGAYTSSFGGTSSACPGVAGVVALMLSVNPALTQAQVKNILKKACIKIDGAKGKYDKKGHSIYYGYGKVDAEKAVQLSIRAKKTK